MSGLRFAAMSFAAWVGASSAVGAAVCSFNLHCVEAEPCVEVSLDITVTEDQISTPDGMVTVNQGGPVNLRVSVGNSPQSMHFLIHQPGGAARYTRHFFQGPRAETYLGSCTE